MTIEASIDINAPAERVYALVSDLPSMGRWSPECYRCDWQDGASGAAPGARFTGHNKIGMRRWSTKGTVVVADGRELTFEIRSVFNLPVSQWSYRVDERPEGGTRLTESTDDRRGALIRTMGKLLLLGTPAADRATRNQNTMRVTLERLKQEAEAASV